MNRTFNVVVVQSLSALFAVALASNSVCIAEPNGPPVFEVEVTNLPEVQTVDGTVNVGNLPDVQTVDGTVAVSNLPQDFGVLYFTRGCTFEPLQFRCSFLITDLIELGEVHITHASGWVNNVGVTALPEISTRRDAGVRTAGYFFGDVVPTTTDVGNDRDIAFSQSFDIVIPDNGPGEDRLWFDTGDGETAEGEISVAGYVVLDADS